MLAQNIFGTEYRPAGIFHFVQSISILSILNKWFEKHITKVILVVVTFIELNITECGSYLL